ncbi:MAG: family 10 glycosylhydrolase, partial [Mameliella sp.]|nr:family 10 glycosylhydrolase [Phaeodactylibacter sp.]
MYLDKLTFLLALLILSACSNPVPEETVSSEPQPTRGVWLTNVDSEALFSKAGLQEAVDHCARLGFNTIYTVTWNRGHTLYPSSVMKEAFGVTIDPKLEGRDPLQELIELAHAKDIKVIAWFEFGFASSYQEADGGYLLRQKPHWAARDSAGQVVSKNGFQWMNAFDPEVQDFVLSLVKEVVQNYDVDGIQGDDRLPALPSLAGYDSLTINAYQAEHNGQSPPINYKDTAWVDWRANRLNDFMGRMSKELRAMEAGLILSFSPSIYPWSKFEYLQDWPTWVSNGWVDEICPQVYRYNIKDYKNALNSIVSEQVAPENHSILAPGILLKVGPYIASDTLLSQMVEHNRSLGLKGEVFFFYEGIKRQEAFFE